MMPYKKKNTMFYIIFGLICYILLCFVVLHIDTVTYQYSSISFMEAIPKGLDHLSTHPLEIVVGPNTASVLGIITLIFAIAVAIVFFDTQRNKHDMSGIESGSAKWNTDLKKYNKDFTDPHGGETNNGKNNLILTNDVFLDLNTFNTQRNNNVVVIGGSGSGKSRYFVKPNILQANTNYVITDPAGELLESTAKFLKEQGYAIKVFNLVQMAKSNTYNPFHYIRDDQGVIMMINCLIKNTTPAGQKSSDPFWEKSEVALLQALCFYLIKYRPVEERNFTSVMRLLRAAEINENNPNAKSKLDKIFDEVELLDPHSIALKQYKTFKMGAGKTLKSILISCSVRLTVFNLTQIESLTKVDNIRLEELGGINPNAPKQALYVIIPAADNTFNFLVSMMYSQLFETLYYIAETQCSGQKLPRHVRFLLDEFANIGQIPEFTQKLSTMRKYEISCNIILQNLAQIKSMYEKDWETILGNSDSCLFLGGQEYSTLEYLSKELGDQTITVRDRSSSRGKSGSSSKSFKQTSRKLMLPDELGKMNNNDCVLMIRGLNPFYGKKYNYKKHPNYQYTGDANKANKYINTINNNSGETSDTLSQKYAAKRSRIYQKATTTPNPKARIISDFMNPEAFVRAFNLTESSDLFKRFVFISSDEITLDPNNTAMPNFENKGIMTQKTNTDGAHPDAKIDKPVDTTEGNEMLDDTKTSKPAEAELDDKHVENIKASETVGTVQSAPKATSSNNTDTSTSDIEDFFFN